MEKAVTITILEQQRQAPPTPVVPVEPDVVSDDDKE
jgi:hypothetical protein